MQEIGDSLDDNLRHLALGFRLSNLQDDEFKKFIEGDDKKPIVVDHEAQLQDYLKGF